MVADENVKRAIAAVRTGQPVLLPTDTVYGLATSAHDEEAAWRVYRLKGREQSQPTALLAPSVEMLFECVPELCGRAGVIVRVLLPGPYTLVLPNPARRYRWLCGTCTDAIGVRVPELPDSARRVLDAAGCLMATSANDPGGPAPATLADVPARIRDGCAVELDEGRLPGVPSTVIDFTGPDPVVIRESEAGGAEAIARAGSALAAAAAIADR
jgi:L-threonylcarbamoyladenylate synthase